ncbi:MAG: hypothetical protein ACR2NN_15270 [Bryobacteraceae bacterium]
MDLALSPDFEAYWCYLTLFSIALIVAIIQVRGLLKGFNNVWADARAWLLLAAYTAVPIALFWLLDRADALHDTSFFAAVVVAVTYRQILSGGTQGMPVPGGFSKAWQPFVTWSDNIAGVIRDRLARKNSCFAADVINHLVEKPEVYEEVRRTVLIGAANPAEVQSQIDEYDKLKPPLDDTGVLKKKATFLYYTLKKLPEVKAEKLLCERGVISSRDYFMTTQEWRGKIVVITAILILSIGCVAAVKQAFTPEYAARYFLWRFAKSNATALEHYRAEQHLEQGIRTGGPRYLETVRQQVTRSLRYEMLPLETADRLLKLLFQNPGATLADSALLRNLADSLRTDNPDLRTRTQRVLLYLADQRHLPVPIQLRAWNPGKEDSATCVDTVSNTWRKLAHGQTSVDADTLACLAQAAANAVTNAGGH